MTFERQSFKTKPYHHGNLRAALLDAAEHFLATEPLDKLSLRALARYVGVSQTAPYRHFPNKAGLLVALAQEGFDSLILQTRTVAEHEADIQIALQQICQVYIQFAIHHPYKFQLMFNGVMHDADLVEALRDRYVVAYQCIEQLCAEGVQKGQFHGDLHVMCNTYWSLLHGLVNLYFDGIVGEVNHLECQSKSALDFLLCGFAHAA